MTYIAKPVFHHPSLSRNALGFTRRDYEGKVSTLCAGCGHDSISAAIVQACFEIDLEPHRLAKLSGIGCSSKTPDYFLGASHGFNTVHGRMPSVLTGANLANRELMYLGVSGDGDSASIGLGQFAHAMRVRAFPFSGEVFDFIGAHELVFVIEQNRDAQLRALLINEGGVDPARLVKVLHYEGAPITARFITGELKARMALTTAEMAK